MAWEIKFSETARKQLAKIDRQAQKDIWKYLPKQKQAAPATQYEYWLACKAVLEGLNRYGQFELPPGPWMTPTAEIPKDSGKGRRQMLKRNVGELTD